MKEKNKRLLIVVGALLLVIGVSLAYFISRVLINGNGANTKVTTANINGAQVTVEGVLDFEDLEILPGHKSVSGIKVTATGNNELIPYNLIWKGTNTLTTPLNFTVYKTSEEISVVSNCQKKSKAVGATTQLSEECTITNLDKLGSEVSTGRINKNDSKVTLASDEFITATSTGEIKYYYVILEYPNLDEPQNYDLEGSLEGEVTVEESNIVPDINIIATYVVQEDGSYKEVNDIPQSGYQINEEKSTCSNSATATGVVPNITIKNLNKNGTDCNLYFDKYVPPITIPDIIAAVNPKSTTPDFSQAATTDEGVYAVSDGMYGGTSYYWRGAVTNNYVKFANFCWRIVRINGDGSIRLIYDGTTCHANGTNTTDSIAVANQKYNASYNQSNYVGWTYSGTSQRTLSGTASNAKTQTENWFNTNITGTNLSKVDTSAKYCNDRDAQSGLTWVISGTYFNYAAYGRLFATKAPTLSCSSGDTYILKTGAITADEVIYAGGVNAQSNTSYYLCNSQDYWTMSPYNWSGGATMFNVSTIGSIDGNVLSTGIGLRPVINLKADTIFSGGTGTQANPYEVEV